MTKRRPNPSARPTRGPGPNGAGAGMVQQMPVPITITPDGKVGVSPVPFSYELHRGTVTGSTDEVVMLRLMLPTGQTVLMMPKDFARQMGQQLMEYGTGISVVQPEQVPGLIVPPATDAG